MVCRRPQGNPRHGRESAPRYYSARSKNRPAAETRNNATIKPGPGLVYAAEQAIKSDRRVRYMNIIGVRTRASINKAQHVVSKETYPRRVAVLPPASQFAAVTRLNSPARPPCIYGTGDTRRFFQWVHGNFLPCWLLCACKVDQSGPR